MRHLNKHQEFISEKVFLDSINESRIYYSPKLTDLMMKDHKDSWILRQFLVETYCLTSEELEKLNIPRHLLIYLSKADADLIGVEINLEDKRIEDVHEYEKSLLDASKTANIDFFVRIFEATEDDAKKKRMIKIESM